MKSLKWVLASKGLNARESLKRQFFFLLSFIFKSFRPSVGKYVPLFSFNFFHLFFLRVGGFVIIVEGAMINHVFISFAAIQIYDLPYVHLHIFFLIIPARRQPFLVLDENSPVKNLKITLLSTAHIKTFSEEASCIAWLQQA